MFCIKLILELSKHRVEWTSKAKQELVKWIKQFAVVKEREFQRLDKLLEKMKLDAANAPMLPFEEK